ncbi:MAG TPA: hypothetical protein V6C86_18775 [Oculatellaceae cyanobacterium]
MRYKKIRNRSGSLIIESISGLCLISGSLVVSALLVVNSGSMMFYKTKLTHINYLAAQYAAAHPADADVQGKTEAYVKEIMPGFGLTPNNLTVTVTELRFHENPAIAVTVNNNFPVFGANCGMPSSLCLKDTEVVAW